MRIAALRTICLMAVTSVMFCFQNCGGSFEGVTISSSSSSSVEPPTSTPPNEEPPAGEPPANSPPSPTGAPVPLSWDDPVFANVVSSGPLRLNGGAVRSNLSIEDDNGDYSVGAGSFTLNYVRIYSREGIRAGGGDINLNWVWVEADARNYPGDHADGLQCYGPGNSGTITVKNSTFRAYSGNATAGYFAADNWRGNHLFENVLFWGGPYGLAF